MHACKNYAPQMIEQIEEDRQKLHACMNQLTFGIGTSCLFCDYFTDGNLERN